MQTFFSRYRLWRNISRVANDNSVIAFVFFAARKDLESEVQCAIDKVKPEYANRVKIFHIDGICANREQNNKSSKYFAEFRRSVN